MDCILNYGLLGTVGLGASTIAASVAGEPLPVVLPAIGAGLAIGAHHVHRDDDQGATDEDVRESLQAVETDGGGP